MPKYSLTDGRTFTNYGTDADVNQSLQKKYNITNANEYRYFLQHNAEKLMNEARSKSVTDSQGNSDNKSQDANSDTAKMLAQYQNMVNSRKAN